MHDEAKKYSSRKDFRRNSPAAYRAAQRHKWLDKVCSHMQLLWERKWTHETVIAEAKRYRYRGEFIKKSPGAYNAANRNGWLSDVYEILSNKPNKWNFESVAKVAKKFETRKNFQNEQQSAYNAARNNGWLDDVCSHMKPQKNKWTKDAVQTEAKKHQSRTVFARRSAGAYNAAKRKGWLDEACAHMKHANVKWTDERIESVAKQYSSRKQFQIGAGGAYKAAAERKLLDTVCSHMPDKPEWTFERVLNEAKKYKTRTEFHNGSYQACKVARIEGWYDSVCAHMDILWEEKWDYDSVLAEARKHEYRSDFQKTAPGAYGKARNMGWLADCQAHMRERPLKWTDENIASEALKYDTRTEFSNYSGAAYKAAIEHGILDKVCAHMKILHNGYNHCVYVIRNDRLMKAYVGITSQRYQLRIQQHKSGNNPCNSSAIINLPDTECEQLTDYIYDPEAVKQYAEQQFVDAFEARGYEIINSSKAIGSVGYSKRKWTRDDCHTEALQYETRWDFQKYSTNAYSAAKNYGWLDDICSHMSLQKQPPDYWTKEKCIEEATKYRSRNEFRQKSTYPYKIACQNGWQDEVFASLPTVIFRKWEKPTADIAVWKRAQEFYDGWLMLEKCSGFILCKHFALPTHKLNSMVTQFKNGWKPSEDDEWLKWKDTECD